MLALLKRYKKFLVDFLYSSVAYALPVLVLQFAVQPMIAAGTTSEENGLFVTLYSVVKLIVTVLLLPLSNLRLLKKRDCAADERLNKKFNGLFAVATLLAISAGIVVNILYRSFSFTAEDIVLFSLVVLLISVHDYFAIEFRLVLNYKKIVVCNLLIVIGYVLGIPLFRLTGRWEYIFICGYALGTVYVLLFSRLWRGGISIHSDKKMVGEYAELSASMALNSSTVYCDKMIIYPVLGGYAVSVYNASAIVSKAISLISSPVRNVLLSYIVNSNDMTVSRRKIKKLLLPLVGGFTAVFLVFWVFGMGMCHLLYPQYAAAAMPYIPLITLAIMAETGAGILNILLLRFSKPIVQTKVSAVKLVTYLVCVLLLAVVLPFKLYGFCAAILLAAITHMVLVIVYLKKSLTLTD